MSARLQPDATQAYYAFLTIDPQGVGHYCVDAHALNNAGQVVVDWSDDPNCAVNYHAWLWDKGRWTSLDYLDPNCPEVSTYLTSLTSWGFAFGSYWGDCPYEPAGGVYVKTRQWYFLPDISGFPYNQGFSMTNNGLAVGVAVNSDFTVFQHWFWDGKKYSSQTYPTTWDVNDWWAGPLFINDSGRIAGQYWDLATPDQRRRAFFQDGAKLTVFDAPDNPDKPMRTGVNGINNAGEVLVIGRYLENGTSYPASFIWRRGIFTPLPNVPFEDAVETYVYGLNDRGDISGIWVDSSNLVHAFVAYRRH